MARTSRTAVARAIGVKVVWVVAWLALPAFAAAADTQGTLGQGTPWELNYSIHESSHPGPVVVIRGGAGTDEPAAAAAAEQIRHWPLLRGTLAVLDGPRAPAAGADSNKDGPKKEPARLDGDFPRSGQGGTATGGQAQAIWHWLQALHPAWVVDLREGSGVGKNGAPAVAARITVVPSREAEQAAQPILEAVNATIDKPERRFVRQGPPADGSLARAAGEHLGARAMTLETSITAPAAPPAKAPAAAKEPAPAKDRSSSKERTPAKKSVVPLPPKAQPISRRARQQRIMVHALLAELKMVDPRLDLDLLPGREIAPDKTWVAIYDAGGTGGVGAASLTRILGGAGMKVVRVGAEEISAGSLGRFHLAIMPGGTGSGEAAALGEKGRQRVREFVEQGGGYMGICAGAYLCICHFDWSLKMLDAKTVSPHWERGVATLKLELTPAGRQILGDRPGQFDVRYHNGPVICRADVAELPDYEVLAYFRTEINKNKTPVGAMVDSPAIAVGRFGKGRVMFISPHPEQTAGLEDLVLHAAQWAVGKP